MLVVAKKKHPEAIPINASSMNLPLKSESVDLITANSVLHHLPEPEKFLLEARRVLKKGGILFVNHEPNLRFSRNGFLWRMSSIASRIVRNANPVYAEINRILMQKGLIDEPLPDAVISSYIDFHSPTAGMHRRGVGIDPDIFGKYFRVKHLETYAHLRKIGEKYDCEFVRQMESILRKRYPLDGSKLTAILIKD